MPALRKRRILWFVAAPITFVLLILAAYVINAGGRPAPVPVKEKLSEWVTYRRIVRLLPRPMIAHVLIIDTRAKGLQFLVTPPDNAEGDPLDARTTSQFLDEFGLTIAINGDGFHPWWSRGPLDYYPHVGDPVSPNGYAASGGDIYAEGNGVQPVLYISRRNSLTFNDKPGNVFNAISGDRMLVLKGALVEGLDDAELDPRTAVGINKNGRWLYLVVVDGRQPFYSDGATFTELAELFVDIGAYYAMALDGGGSSAMVVRGEDGRPVILNSPIDHYIPGTERPVANHIGIYLEE
jgi:hypothetical protein